MKKNEIFELEIEDITFEGYGVGKINGMVIFVANAVKGDILLVKILKVKKNYAYAKIEKFLKKSDLRCESDCKFSEKCGGCVFRNIKYEEELKLKQNHVQQAIKRIAGLNTLKISPIVPAPSCNSYRNKVMLPVRNVDGKIKFGFFASNSHNFVALDSCKLQAQIFTDILKFITTWLQDNGISAYDEKTGLGIVRHIYIRSNKDNTSLMLCIVINSDDLENKNELTKKLVAKFSNISSVLLNINKNQTNVVLGENFRILYGNDYIFDHIDKMKFKVSAASFFQVNSEQVDKLYRKAKQLANVKSSDILLDLYCGTGTIGLSMAKNAKELIGIEINENAIKDAKENASINNINNANFYCMDAKNAFHKLEEIGKKPNVIIVDPPRKGLNQIFINDIAKSKIEKIVYISCNVSTLARDMKLLMQYNYRAVELSPFDMFPRTGHVETVVLMSRVDGK